MQSKAQQAAADGADGDEEYDEEVSEAWREFMRQSPGWLTSMVVHMILLLVLALIGLGGDVDDDLKEIVIGKPDIIDEVLEEEEQNESLNEELETDIESESEEQVEDIVSPVDYEVESPDVQIPNDADDFQLAASQVEFSDFAFQSAVSGDMLGDLGGFAQSGLGGRTAAGRAGAVRRGGGSKGSETAVEAGLRWLAKHQNYDGSWNFIHTPGGKCSGFPNPGSKNTKMGATGLALLPFLGAGYTHKEGKYEQVVQKGLRYLVGNMQVANNAGRLYEANGDGHCHMYAHGIAACALAEAYGMTQDPKLKAPAQLALNYIVAAQHPQNGGWLYKPRQGGDTSVVGWQIMALKSGILSYLQVPAKVKPLANRWLDSVQWDLPPGGYGVGSSYGYRKAKDRPEVSATTAIGLICRNYLGAKKDDPGLRRGVEKLAKHGPHSGDMYYNYYGSMTMFQNDGPDGEHWKSWNSRMRDHLIKSQVKEGPQQGSWHFSHGHGGSAGGRVYNTALATMTLEVYYRYMPVYQKANVEQDDFPLE
jgi:hypothetical protein